MHHPPGVVHAKKFPSVADSAHHCRVIFAVVHLAQQFPPVWARGLDGRHHLKTPRHCLRAFHRIRHVQLAAASSELFLAHAVQLAQDHGHKPSLLHVIFGEEGAVD